MNIVHVLHLIVMQRIRYSDGMYRNICNMGRAAA